MAGLKDVIYKKLTALLELYFPSYSDLLYNALVLVWIFIFAIVLHLVLHRIILRTVEKLHMVDRSGSWLNALKKERFFRNIILIIQTIFIQLQAKAWLETDSSLFSVLIFIADMAILFFSLLGAFAFLNALEDMMNSRAQKFRIPIRGITQTAKLILGLMFGLIMIAMLLGKSPLILLSGLGAFSAVLLLVFKDPIMGLVAGIQLSANNMLMVGDWLEMPKYNADGDVIDIALTTVKVQNWDKTITTIPTYALISNSFKNWRGMSESGGRRIKRSLFINTSSIKFLSEEDVQKLKKSQLLSAYLEEKLAILKKANSKEDMSSRLNGRRLTNIGTFRSYLISYLKSHPQINQKMTLMVRQLASSGEGLPLEVYAFSNTTKWAKYEGIQSDIFDHIFAVLPEFGLRIHEAPTGEDIRALGAQLGGESK